MNKSLLQLLEEEKKAVEDINYFKQTVSDFHNRLFEHVENVESVESLKRIINIYEEKVKESEKNLLAVRTEIKEYFSFIQSL